MDYMSCSVDAMSFDKKQLDDRTLEAQVGLLRTHVHKNTGRVESTRTTKHTKLDFITNCFNQKQKSSFKIF